MLVDRGLLGKVLLGAPTSEIVPIDGLIDFSKIELTLEVNGEVRQNAFVVT